MREIDSVLSELNVQVTRRGFLKLALGLAGIGIGIGVIAYINHYLQWCRTLKELEERRERYVACMEELNEDLKILNSPLKVGSHTIIPLRDLKSLDDVLKYTKEAWRYVNCRYISIRDIYVVINGGKPAIYNLYDKYSGEYISASAMVAFDILYNLYLASKAYRKIGNIKYYCKKYANKEIDGKELGIVNCGSFSNSVGTFIGDLPHIIVEEGVSPLLEELRKYDGFVDLRIRAFFEFLKDKRVYTSYLYESLKRDFGDVKVYTIFTIDRVDIAHILALVSAGYYEDALRELDPTAFLAVGLDDPRTIVGPYDVAVGYGDFKHIKDAIMEKIIDVLKSIIYKFR